MTLKRFTVIACALLGATACVTPPRAHEPPARAGTAPGAGTPPAAVRPVRDDEPAGLRAAKMLDELARIASLAPEPRRRELAALEATGRRLDDGQRFQLAALLEREDNTDALERGLKALNALGAIETAGQAVVELLKKSVKARLELRQQSARAQELQDKLEQIKALEKSLQQRDALPKTP